MSSSSSSAPRFSEASKRAAIVISSDDNVSDDNNDYSDSSDMTDYHKIFPGSSCHPVTAIKRDEGSPRLTLLDGRRVRIIFNSDPDSDPNSNPPITIAPVASGRRVRKRSLLTPASPGTTVVFNDFAAAIPPVPVAVPVAVPAPVAAPATPPVSPVDQDIDAEFAGSNSGFHGGSDADDDDDGEGDEGDESESSAGVFYDDDDGDENAGVMVPVAAGGGVMVPVMVPGDELAADAIMRMGVPAALAAVLPAVLRAHERQVDMDAEEVINSEEDDAVEAFYDVRQDGDSSAIDDSEMVSYDEDDSDYVPDDEGDESEDIDEGDDAE